MDLLRKGWEIQREKMQKKYLSSGSRQNKHKLKKLQLLTKEVRESFIEMYF